MERQAAESQQPSDITKVQQLLSSMGVEEFEPRVVNQLLDFMYKYVTEVLLDAEVYSEHAGKRSGQVDMDDVMLAIQARNKYSFAQPPTQDEVFQMIDDLEINKKDMPKFQSKPGLLIPEEKDCITAQNIQFRPPAGR